MNLITTEETDSIIENVISDYGIRLYKSISKNIYDATKAYTDGSATLEELYDIAKKYNISINIPMCIIRKDNKLHWMRTTRN